ncbi:hypothetical protein J7L01_04055 [bacterium]|nr:hypothetical protein [bacterium]
MIERVYPPKLPEWLSLGGDDFEVVLASEAYYVRNVADTAFPSRLDNMELKNLRRHIALSLQEVLFDLGLRETDIRRDEDRRFFVERFSAPSEITEHPAGSSLFLSEDEGRWLAINAIDHLRFRFIGGGSDIETSYRSARAMEERFENYLPFAYSEHYGFLTSRPTECGTALVMRFYVHIPGIIFSKDFSKLRDKLSKAGAILRPLPDESMSSEGHVFLVHTAHSLGLDEEDILADAQDTLNEIIEMEYNARAELLSKARYQIEDKIMRGIGVLTHARMIARNEGYAIANALRLGAAENITRDVVDIMSATELYFVGQKIHLTRLTGKADGTMEDTNRAELFRSYLKQEE